VDGVEPAVTTSAFYVLGFDDLNQPGAGRVRLRVEDVNAGGPKAGDDEIAALHKGVGGVGAEGGTAGVPAEMVKLVPGVGDLHPGEDLGVGGGPGV
jgi:hypothetical protein